VVGILQRNECRSFIRLIPIDARSYEEREMFKFLGSVAGIIFVIGLLVVIGILALIF
jgi:hypothetical protein